MTRVICVASGKGGVGKTTVSSNIAAALTEFGKRVLIIDTNLTTPNLGFHLGIPFYPKTIHDVLRGEAYPEEATYVHPTGLSVMPASISLKDLKNTTPENLESMILDLVGDHDVIILDGAAGLGKEGLAAVKAADELVVVTNPQLASVTDALKTVKLAEETGTHILGIVVNRVRGSGSELSMDEVEAMLGHPVISMIPEDDEVHESLAAKTPVVFFNPDTRSAHEMKKLAGAIVGIDYEPPVQEEKFGVFSKLFNFLRM